MSDEEDNEVQQFHIHGDNIVECERTLELIINALDGNLIQLFGPYGSPVCPSFALHTTKKHFPLVFTFLPGFNRWDQDILSLVRDRGGQLRESADAIITEVYSTLEIPLIAIEYCGALPAGNQAWQRNGRAYSFARAKIPYAYIAELGGFELNADRTKKASRLPNPAVPFSYISFSASLDTPVLPIFVPNPGASLADISYYQNVFGSADFLQFLRALIFKESGEQATTILEWKVLELVRLLSSSRRRSDTITAEQWAEAYHFVFSGGSLANFVLKSAPMPWAKIASIAALTPTARLLMALAAKHAIGLTSSVLPICVISVKERLTFARNLNDIYHSLPSDFTEWLSVEAPLTISWVMGFKPRGDDARPDRGLAPFGRMLIGDKADLLTIVYGPALASTWPLLHDDPVKLMKRNGLWESILTVSDAILIDSSTANDLKIRAFLRSHWAAGLPKVKSSSIIVKACPLRIGEQDVDTILHLLLSRLGSAQVFEGMCNPPGGDWSGISMVIPDRSLELRWLSLPRVTSTNSKRPDHVFQIFDFAERPIALIIESKDRSRGIEDNIGNRLIQYVLDLISSVASVQRASNKDTWEEGKFPYDTNRIQFTSAAAFIMNTPFELEQVSKRAKVDLILGFKFGSDRTSCDIHILASTESGNMVSKFLRSIESTSLNIRVIKV